MGTGLPPESTTCTSKCSRETGARHREAQSAELRRARATGRPNESTASREMGSSTAGFASSWTSAPPFAVVAASCSSCSAPCPSPSSAASCCPTTRTFRLNLWLLATPTSPMCLLENDPSRWSSRGTAIFPPSDVDQASWASALCPACCASPGTRAGTWAASTELSVSSNCRPRSVSRFVTVLLKASRTQTRTPASAREAPLVMEIEAPDMVLLSRARTAGAAAAARTTKEAATFSLESCPRTSRTQGRSPWRGTSMSGSTPASWNRARSDAVRSSPFTATLRCFNGTVWRASSEMARSGASLLQAGRVTVWVRRSSLRTVQMSPVSRHVRVASTTAGSSEGMTWTSCWSWSISRREASASTGAALITTATLHGPRSKRSAGTRACKLPRFTAPRRSMVRLTSARHVSSCAPLLVWFRRPPRPPCTGRRNRSLRDEVPMMVTCHFCRFGGS
mmetsp:Transcript_29881/g.87023  ORF Transcript_29881/g.87023 Transcript_29881/m.87023 type:complete len:451 (-) Transcript_29881:3253-4605(-)